jgi:hypothetical protein
MKLSKKGCFYWCGSPFNEIETSVRKFIFRMVTSDFYDAFGQFFTIINCLMFAIEYSSESNQYRYVREIILLICTWFFVLEFLMLIITLGPRQYASKFRNLLDLSVVIVSLIEFFTPATLKGFKIYFFRIFRLLRVVRLARRTQLFGGLIRTLMFSLPALYSAFFMLFLVFFAFGVAATDFFGKVKPGFYINPNQGSFNNVFNSIVLLIRMSTGENWNGIMRDCAVEEPDCSEKLDNCGSAALSYTFFPSFIITVSFVMISMVSAVIMDQFAEQHIERVVPAITQDDFSDFATEWSRINGSDDFLMHIATLPKFLSTFPRGLVPRSAKEYKAKVVICVHVCVRREKEVDKEYKEKKTKKKWCKLVPPVLKPNKFKYLLLTDGDVH